MALSNEQLLMLNVLIYTDYCNNGDSVEKIILQIEDKLNCGGSIDNCEMTTNEWRDLIKIIKNEPSLLTYTIQEYYNDSSGMRAACFVNDVNDITDVNIVFRGTSGSYEWHDNGEGGYVSDTIQQKKAADYVNKLPEEYGNNMTVTGHSKGGNKAQYVTIATNRIHRCISYDGQGFSQEFVEKYKEQIASKADSIISICASKDIVNCLLFPIAGTHIYIETKDQSNFLYYHKPNILLDEDGKLRTQTEQDSYLKFVTEYTTYISSNLDEPERSITIDGLIALFEDGKDKESILQTIYAGGNALSHLDDFIFNYVGEKYGLPVELALTYLATLALPFIFKDDWLHACKETLDFIVTGIENFADDIAKKLRKFGQKATIYADNFVAAAVKFINNVKNWCNNNFINGYTYATTNPQICLDTYKLRDYAQRIQNINQRINNLDKRMDSLYWRVGLLDLWNLIQADIFTGYSWRLLRCSSYLYDTASDFDSMETELINMG